ncbi:MAG: ferrochelatase [Candidatus Acidiferrales bacterium]
MAEKKKIGIVLFQLGGPENLQSVEPFLYNLFCDPDIINFPGAWLARKPLAKWISTRRSKIAQEHYAAIGGGSPIRVLTEQQARALEEAVRPHVEAHAVVAMRYWHPLTAEAVSELHSLSLDEIVLLPLYPHYSFATTRSSQREWNRLYKPGSTPVRSVEQFHDHPLYIAAVAEKIESVLAHIPRPSQVQLVFSAHGLPLSLIENGDPYPRQIEDTVDLVRQFGAWSNPHVLCYQSRVGRQKWLEPSLTSTIEKLAGQGVKRMLVIPVSFVTDHIETLHEINLEAREEAEKLGVEEFLMMPALNDSPKFIACLADLVLQAVNVPSVMASATF